MNDTIRILGLQFSACHGVQPEEMTLPQPFEVDVEITRDLSDAADSPASEATARLAGIDVLPLLLALAGTPSATIRSVVGFLRDIVLLSLLRVSAL